MEVKFAPELQEKIDRAAAQAQRDADRLIQDIVEQHLDYDEWFRKQVQVGIDEIERGEFLTEEEMDERMRKLLEMK